MRKLTTEEYLEKARSVHGDRYDYSLVKYTKGVDKVRIICREHGEFTKIAKCHTDQGQGCPRCTSRGLMITENFIKHARSLHGDRYDYSNSVSENSMSKVVIVCSVHGEFEQTVTSHLSGKGCPKCGIVKCTEPRRNNERGVLRRMIGTHGDLYDYSEFKYVNINTKGIIRCPVHGKFKQSAKGHIRGQGCPRCAKNYKMTTESFSEKANIVHGGRYEYDRVKYVNAATPVVITCKAHGDFIQKPSDHLSGHGCQVCANGGFRDRDKGYLYVLSSDEFVKVGISNVPNKRFQDLKICTPFHFDVTGVWEHEEGYAVRCVESVIHNSFQSAQLSGFSGCTEWIIPSSELYLSLDVLVSMFDLKPVNLKDI